MKRDGTGDELPLGQRLDLGSHITPRSNGRPWIRGDRSIANRAEDLAQLAGMLGEVSILPGGHNLHLESPAALAEHLAAQLP